MIYKRFFLSPSHVLACCVVSTLILCLLREHLISRLETEVQEAQSSSTVLAVRVTSSAAKGNTLEHIKTLRNSNVSHTKHTKYPKGYWIQKKKEQEEAKKRAPPPKIYHVPKLSMSISNEATSDTSLKSLINTKRKTFQRNAPDCYCPNGRPNYIYYTNCPRGRNNMNRGAGIKDRMNILRNLMWYADELCAKVVLRCTPNVWLSEAHGCYSPEDAIWPSYFTPVRNVSGMVGKADILVETDNLQELFKGLEKIHDEPSIAEYEMLSDRIQTKSKPFYWVFDENFWSTNMYTPETIWPGQILKHGAYSEQCSMVDLDTSEELLNIGELMMKSVGLRRSEEYVTLHLRQGDFKGDFSGCDTTPSTVVEYLKCSLDGHDVDNVVVMTNGNESYFDALNREFLLAFPEKKLIPLDQEVQSKSFLEQLSSHNTTRSHHGEKFLKDNCYLFSAEKVLVSFAKFHLERGHVYCRQCDKGGSKNAAAII